MKIKWKCNHVLLVSLRNFSQSKTCSYVRESYCKRPKEVWRKEIKGVMKFSSHVNGIGHPNSEIVALKRMWVLNILAWPEKVKGRIKLKSEKLLTQLIFQQMIHSSIPFRFTYLVIKVTVNDFLPVSFDTTLNFKLKHTLIF